MRKKEREESKERYNNHIDQSISNESLVLCWLTEDDKDITFFFLSASLLFQIEPMLHKARPLSFSEIVRSNTRSHLYHDV